MGWSAIAPTRCGSSPARMSIGPVIGGNAGWPDRACGSSSLGRPLRSTAELTVLRFDPDDRRVLVAAHGNSIRGIIKHLSEIGDQEIRVPVTEEEIVVEKRPVVKEEIVVTKRAVEETQNVEADVRRERVDVDDQAIRDRAKSAGRKAADAAENVKDRIDGNPRSRPGPDAADRR